jgi:hypothetical protein
MYHALLKYVYPEKIGEINHAQKLDPQKYK